jgi:hypothetical protein
MNWNVGDIAIIANTVHFAWSSYVGTPCTIVSTLDPSECVSIEGHSYQYLVQLCDGTDVAAAEPHLKPFDGEVDEYDGHETTTWDKCDWQPKELKVIES